MAYIIEDRLKDAIEEADRERALKEVAEATVRDKGKAAEDAEERAQALVEQKMMETDVKLGGTELKLAKAKSLNLAQANEIDELKATLEAYKNK